MSYPFQSRWAVFIVFPVLAVIPMSHPAALCLPQTWRFRVAFPGPPVAPRSPDQGPLKGDPWRCPQMSTQRSLKIWTSVANCPNYGNSKFYFWKSLFLHIPKWNGSQLTRSQAIECFKTPYRRFTHLWWIDFHGRAPKDTATAMDLQAEIGPNGPTKLVGPCTFPGSLFLIRMISQKDVKDKDSYCHCWFQSRNRSDIKCYSCIL